MEKEHKVYTEDEIKNFFDPKKVIKYTVVNPISGSEEYYYHDCDIASIEIYNNVVGSRYETNEGMLDYRFAIDTISNVESISYDQLKHEVTPS